MIFVAGGKGREDKTSPLSPAVPSITQIQSSIVGRMVQDLELTTNEKQTGTPYLLPS